MLVAGGEALSDRAHLCPRRSFSPRASSTLSHPTRALGGGTALTNSNSPGAGASEIGIEDGLRRERTRCLLTHAQWVPAPGAHWRGGTSPQPGDPSQHYVFPSNQASFLLASGQLRSESELSGSEASTVLSCIPEA